MPDANQGFHIGLGNVGRRRRIGLPVGAAGNRESNQKQGEQFFLHLTLGSAKSCFAQLVAKGFCLKCPGLDAFGKFTNQLIVLPKCPVKIV
jgi:hypothetical protein